MHAAAPSTLVYDPMPQEVHVLDFAALATVLRGHKVQLVPPFFASAWPGKQSKQLVPPFFF